MRRRPAERPGLVKDVGGIRLATNRVPAWLLVVIAGIVAWGLFYVITYSVTETGSFEPPAGVILLLLGP